MTQLYVNIGYCSSGYIQEGITIYWNSKVIFIPKSFLTFISGTNYILDTNAFRLALKDIEDAVDGISFPDTHTHNTVVNLGGVQYARTIEIINGYTITFEDGSYSVSLVGSNNNILEVTNLNRVSLRSNNSAGLINIPELQHAAYDGGVWVNSTTGVSGTMYPIGTSQHPVNNLADANIIALSYGLSNYYLSGNFITDRDFSGVTFIAQNSFLTDGLTFNGYNFNNCNFQRLRITGTIGLGSNNSLEFDSCYINNVSNLCGVTVNGRMEGNIIIFPGKIISSVGLVVEGDNTTVNMGLAMNTIFSADILSGSLLFTNAVTGSLIELNVSGSKITLDSTCTGGEYWIEGYGKLQNNSTMVLKGNQLLAFPTANENANAVWSHSSGSLVISKLTEAWGRLGLDPSKPLITGSTSVTFGDIVMALTEASGQVTLARQ